MAQATRDKDSPVLYPFPVLLPFPRYADGCSALGLSLTVLRAVLALRPLLILLGQLWREPVENMAANIAISRQFRKDKFKYVLCPCISASMPSH